MSQSTPHLAPPSLVSVSLQVLVLPALPGTYVNVGDFMCIHFWQANPFIHNSARDAWHDVFHWAIDTDRTPCMHRLFCEWYLAHVCYVTLRLITHWFQHSPLMQYVCRGEFKYSGITSARESDSAVRSHKQAPVTDFPNSLSLHRASWYKCLCSPTDALILLVLESTKIYLKVTLKHSYMFQSVTIIRELVLEPSYSYNCYNRICCYKLYGGVAAYHVVILKLSVSFVKENYSDTLANKDNSFRNHIR